MEYTVTDIQRFCMHDGPGIRTTVFLKGCPLRCFWCHNPETNKTESQIFFVKNKCIGCQSCTVCEKGAHIFGEDHVFDRSLCVSCGRCAHACPTGALSVSGKVMTGEEIVDIALRDKAFYCEKGGITLSGGEPMLYPEKCISLLSLAKGSGLNTAVESCGYFPTEYVERLAQVTDTFLWDIKDTNDCRHRENTGVSNRLILENLAETDKYGVPIILRCVLLKGVNLNVEHISRVKEIFASLKNGVRIDWLKCHALGTSKAHSVGIIQRDLEEYIPSEEDMSIINQQSI